MKPGDEKKKDAADQAQDDDDLVDFDLEEDVLDVETSDTSSASAIEGVEMLDFLDDDAEEVNDPASDSGFADLDSDPGEPPAAVPPAPSAPEMTIDFSPDDMAEAPAAGDAEITNLDEFMPVEEAGEVVDDIEEAEPPVAEVEEPADETDDVDADMFAGLETESAEPVDEQPADAEAVMPTFGEAGEDEVAAIEDDDTFAFRDDDEPAEAPKPTFEAPAAGAVTAAPFSDNGGKAGKRRSKMPMILSSLFAIVLLGGGVIAGLFFAGLLPGFRTPEVVTPVPAPPTIDPAVAARNKQINEAEQSLRLLYHASKSVDGIDGEKLTEAQQIIATLPEDVLAEEPVQEHVKRFDELAVTYKKQQKQEAEEERKRKFDDAFLIAEAAAPMTLDVGMIEEARKWANEDELASIEALEKSVADYQAEQARLAKAKIEEEKAAMFDAIVETIAAKDATAYVEAIAAYVSAYPDDARTPDLQAVADSDPPALTTVTEWNQLLNELAQAQPEKLSEDQRTELIATADAHLAQAGMLTGAVEVADYVAALRKMKPPEVDVTALRKSLTDTFTAPATTASFVFAKTDGERYYTAEKPSKKGDNYLITRFTDLEGTTELVELAPADADRANTGVATVAATAKAVQVEVAKMDADNWKTAMIDILQLIEADGKLDPVIKAQWFVAVATAAGRANTAMGFALAPYQKLAETGVDAKFNWTDPQAASEKRADCAKAIAALPKVDDARDGAADAVNVPEKFAVAKRLVPVGVLNRDAETETWKSAMIEDAPKSGEVFVLLPDDADGFTSTSVGEITDGNFTLAEGIDPKLVRQGRIVYAEVTK